MGFVRNIMWLVLVLMIFTERSDAAVYQVGDATGWSIPSTNEFYDNWTENKNFRVGDQLSFNWTGTHDVAVVSENEYESCTKVSNVNSTSPVVITLNSTGNHYYICTIGNHCQSGQKLEIEVRASNSTAPAGSPPATTPGTNTTAPAPSSAPSFGPIGALCATMSLLIFSFLA